MKRIIKKPQKTKAILNTLLEQKRLKHGVSCMTEKSTSYRIFRVAATLAFIACLIICLLLILGSEGRISAHTTYGGEAQLHQQPEFEMVRNSTILVSSMLGIMLASQVFLILKLPILQLICAFVPSIILLFHYPTTMEKNWGVGGAESYVSKNVIPLAVFMFCALVCAVLTMIVNRNNQKGRDEISEIIYSRYSITADKLTEKQWEEILSDYKIG